MRSALKPPETITRMWPKPSASRASRTFQTSRGFTPVGVKSPISCHSERSTMRLEVSRRTPHSRSPKARAQARAVRTESFSKSTRAIRGTPAMWRANAAVAATVSPEKVAKRPPPDLADRRAPQRVEGDLRLHLGAQRLAILGAAVLPRATGLVAGVL